MKKMVSFMLLGLVALGCGGPKKPTFNTATLRSSVKIGMTTDQLLSAFGEPSKKITDPKPGDAEWWYIDHDGKNLVILDIRDNRVASYH